ncbi:hypothetical protein MMC17_009545 [Xylographa soralifera]|nr:hypothetical protein [Xylographa soralifera]
MQYVRSISGSVSKTWNSINPATLSGAIDVVVVEQGDGSLACSPFHVRFGKFSLLRPYEKKVEFKVNNVKQNYAMKLGEGGEAFFVFETSDDIPESLQTSPIISPTTSPEALAAQNADSTSSLQEPEFLDIASETGGRRPSASVWQENSVLTAHTDQIAHSDPGNLTPLSVSSPEVHDSPVSGGWTNTNLTPRATLERSASEEFLPLSARAQIAAFDEAGRATAYNRASEPPDAPRAHSYDGADRSQSPPPLTMTEAVKRATSLSKKLSGLKIPTHVTETGDLMLDMNGYKSSEEETLRAEVIARRILSEELEGNYDIGALIGADMNGNLWIYSSEEAKESAARKAQMPSLAPTITINDAASDPGYHSDEERVSPDPASPKASAPELIRLPSSGLVTPPQTPPDISTAADANRNYAKTLRLTSEQLKALKLKPGLNSMSFSVNRATCQACMYYWSHNVPVVISDIDGTITKSDALGHVLNMLGRDWTHIGVAKLYTDIAANGYNILYLTSRSVGQADTTRAYLHGITQEGYKLPKGPVILSPDRTIAALRREVYLRKPEVFKMACLRDIQTLFSPRPNPFYAGFGNRFTDALSYRSVNIPSNRIFTINSNAEVSLDLLTLNMYKSSYVTMREVVDHFFPPVSLLIAGGGEEFTDFNFWRDTPLDLDEFSASDSDDETTNQKARGRRSRSLRSQPEGSEGSEDEEQGDGMEDSYISRDSVDDEAGDLVDSILESIEDEELSQSLLLEEVDDQNRILSTNNVADPLELDQSLEPKGEPARGRQHFYVPKNYAL